MNVKVKITGLEKVKERIAKIYTIMNDAEKELRELQNECANAKFELTSEANTDTE